MLLFEHNNFADAVHLQSTVIQREIFSFIELAFKAYNQLQWYGLQWLSHRVCDITNPNIHIEVYGHDISG